MSRFETELFVPSPDPDLVCPICQCVLDNAVECVCRHVFCRICIETWLKKHFTCPTCRESAYCADLKPVLPIVQNVISRLPMLCANHNTGCEVKLNPETFIKHVERCIFKLLSCKYEQCRQSIIQRDLEAHQLVCDYRVVPCAKGCSLMVLATESSLHDCVSSLKEKVSGLEKKIEDLEAKNKALGEQLNDARERAERARSVELDSISEYTLDSPRSGSVQSEEFVEDFNTVYSDGSHDNSGYVQSDDGDDWFSAGARSTSPGVSSQSDSGMVGSNDIRSASSNSSHRSTDDDSQISPRRSRRLQPIFTSSEDDSSRNSRNNSPSADERTDRSLGGSGHNNTSDNEANSSPAYQENADNGWSPNLHNSSRSPSASPASYHSPDSYVSSPDNDSTERMQCSSNSEQGEERVHRSPHRHSDSDNAPNSSRSSPYYSLSRSRSRSRSPTPSPSNSHSMPSRNSSNSPHHRATTCSEDESSTPSSQHLRNRFVSSNSESSRVSYASPAHDESGSGSVGVPGGDNMSDRQLELMDECAELSDENVASARTRPKRRRQTSHSSSDSYVPYKRRRQSPQGSDEEGAASRSANIDDSSDEDSDTEYIPPEVEPPDLIVSDDQASSDSDYIVHVPKTAAQLLTEYDSAESDDSWQPRH